MSPLLPARRAGALLLLTACCTYAMASLLIAEPAQAGEPAPGYVVVSSLLRTGTDVEVLSRTVPWDQKDTAAAALTARTGMAATVSGRVHALAASNDSFRGSQWALDAVPFETSWTTANGAGVTVAVIDTGVDSSHPDLAGQVLEGKDFTGTGPANTDPSGHGTHVAGVIAALAGNNLGITGAAPGVRILPVRVLDASGAGWDADVAAGIVWAADHGARVINLSLGGTYDALVDQAVSYATGQGAVVVAAAGNSGNAGNEPSYPAALDGVLAVGAVDSTRAVSYYSNRGAYVDLVAPGSGIWSTYLMRSYSSQTGTSMAAPYAAAEAALIAAANPGMSESGIRQRMRTSATDIGPSGRDDASGWGLINPLAALCSACTAPAPPSAAPIPTPVASPSPGSSVPAAPGVGSGPLPGTSPAPGLTPAPRPVVPVPGTTPAPGGPVQALTQFTATTSGSWSVPGQAVRILVVAQTAAGPVPVTSAHLADATGREVASSVVVDGRSAFVVAPRQISKYTVALDATASTPAASASVTAWVAPALQVSYNGKALTWVLSPSAGQRVRVVNTATGAAAWQGKAHAHGITRKSVPLTKPGSYLVSVSGGTQLLPVKSTSVTVTR